MQVFWIPEKHRLDVYVLLFFYEFQFIKILLFPHKNKKIVHVFHVITKDVNELEIFHVFFHKFTIDPLALVNV